MYPKNEIIKSIEDLKDHNIPLPVLADIHRRIADWLSCKGNTADDPYIQRQLAYAEQFIK